MKSIYTPQRVVAPEFIFITFEAMICTRCCALQALSPAFKAHGRSILKEVDICRAITDVLMR